ncbi:hypothetical protein EON65_29445 [archaeon]|nr:MAG: hypothetical protein EON65_29445 [archaeon]
MTSFASTSSNRSSGIVSRLLGHKGRCFDIRYASDECNRLLSASEDGEAKFWDAQKLSALHTFVHNPKAEALRCCFIDHKICVAGSDGNVSLWSNVPDATIQATKSTAPLHRLNTGSEENQIYVCEPNPHGKSELLVGANNTLMLWDLNHPAVHRSAWEIESIPDRSEVFGGERNVNQSVFVFDAKWSPRDQGVMAVAASDATVRILDVRTEENEHSVVLDFQRTTGIKLGHTTSVSWSDDGQLLSVSFGSGCVAVFDIRQVGNFNVFFFCFSS